VRPIVAGSQCAGSVRYYAAAVAAGVLLIDDRERHLPLRHSHHRYVIDGPNGPVTLTVPIVHSTCTMATTMADVRIADHGNWQRLHWGALYSAYGRSPFFDFIADELHDIIYSNTTSLLEFNMQLHRLVVDFMALPIETHLVSETTVPADAIDLRHRLGQRKPDDLPLVDVPYYQVWSSRHPFTPSMSILDLAMNTGREGLLTLLAMAASGGDGASAS